MAPGAAAAVLAGAGLAHLDPAGIWTEADLLRECEQGACVEVSTEGGRGVYLVQVQNGVAWVAAAAGEGACDWTRLGLGAIEAHAAGLDAVAFATSRRGLVLKAARHGYRVAGFVLRKDLK